MKRIALIFSIFILVQSAYAQKQYLNLVASRINETTNSCNINISGKEIPDGYETHYAKADGKTIGAMINKLAKLGYVVEYLSGNASSGEVLIMAKDDRKDEPIKEYTQIVASRVSDDTNSSEMSISGIIPEDIESRYEKADGKTIGGMINKLSRRGFVVEAISGDSNGEIVLLSRIVNDEEAKKDYVNIVASGVSDATNKTDMNVSLYQRLDNVKSHYDKTDGFSIGEMIGKIQELGFEVEFISGSSSNGEIVLMSKNIESTGIKNYTDDSHENSEIERFSITGMPTTKNDKGVQVIKYSDNTTRKVLNK